MRSLVLCSLSSSVNRTHVVSVDPLGRQYTRNRPNFSLILIFKTLANGHVFITSQRSHRTSEGVNTGGVCVCVCFVGAAGPDATGRGGPWLQPAGHLSHICRSCHQRRETNTQQAEVMCFLRFLKGPAIPAAPQHHSNMLMYLCSALIGPSDARPCPTCVRGKPPVSPAVGPPPLRASARC